MTGHGKGTELCQGKARLGVRRNVSAMRVVTHRDGLPGEADGAPCLSVLKGRLDNVLGDMLHLVASPEEVSKLDLMFFEVPFQLNYSNSNTDV